MKNPTGEFPFDMFGKATADGTVVRGAATNKGVAEQDPRSCHSAGVAGGIQLGSDVWPWMHW